MSDRHRIEPPTIDVVPLWVRVHRTIHDWTRKHWIVGNLAAIVLRITVVFSLAAAALWICFGLGPSLFSFALAAAVFFGGVYVYLQHLAPRLFPPDMFTG
jgi:hypothetical protein